MLDFFFGSVIFGGKKRAVIKSKKKGEWVENTGIRSQAYSSMMAVLINFMKGEKNDVSRMF